MPSIEFTPHLALHVACRSLQVDALDLATALDIAFAQIPRLKGYVLDDQNIIRQHVAIFVDNELIRDRRQWNLPLKPDSQIYVMQALSGG